MNSQSLNRLRWTNKVFIALNVILLCATLYYCSSAFHNMGVVGSNMKPTDGSSTARVAAAVDPKTPEGHKIDVAEGQALIQEVSKVGNLCDRAFHFTNAAIAASNIQYLYRNAEVGVDQCQRAAESVREVTIPPHASNEVQAKIRDAVGNLFEVYSDERSLMERLKSFANNGNVRPSDIEDYRQDFDRAQALKLGAAAELAQAIGSEGAVSPQTTLKRHHHRKAA